MIDPHLTRKALPYLLADIAEIDYLPYVDEEPSKKQIQEAEQLVQRQRQLNKQSSSHPLLARLGSALTVGELPYYQQLLSAAQLQLKSKKDKTANTQQEIHGEGKSNQQCERELILGYEFAMLKNRSVKVKQNLIGKELQTQIQNMSCVREHLEYTNRHIKSQLLSLHKQRKTQQLQFKDKMMQ